MTSENGCLKRCLEEKEEELKKCLQSTDALRARSMVGRASDLAASKIVELTKKIRHLNAEVEKERHKAKVLHKKLSDLETSNNEPEGKPSENTAQPVETKSSETEVKTLTEKLSVTNKKLFDSRNDCQMLKQELKTTQKVSTLVFSYSSFNLCSKPYPGSLS